MFPRRPLLPGRHGRPRREGVPGHRVPPPGLGGSRPRPRAARQPLSRRRGGGGGRTPARSGRWPGGRSPAGSASDRHSLPPTGGGGAAPSANGGQERAGPAPLSVYSQSEEGCGARSPRHREGRPPPTHNPHRIPLPSAPCPPPLPAGPVRLAAAAGIPGLRRHSPGRIPCHSRSIARRRRVCLIRVHRGAGSRP